MCTATWILTPEGLDLLFNRDEQRTRGVALPPAVGEARGVRYLAPVDVDGGGTWVGANELGVVLGVLNGVDRRSGSGASPAAGERSRGVLVRGLLGARDGAEVEGALAAQRLETYRGFVLLVLVPGAEPRAHRWDGLELAPEPVALPMTSSGFDPEGVRRSRSVLLERMCAGAPPSLELLERFHASHEPERGVLSPCMHRPDVGTVSLTHVRVRPQHVALRYGAGAPCRAVLGEPRELRRG